MSVDKCYTEIYHEVNFNHTVDSIDKSGVLLKQGKRLGNWKQTHFALKDAVITYTNEKGKGKVGKQ